MPDITKFSKKELFDLKSELEKQYKNHSDKELNLDMSRGKPSIEQLDISNELLNKLDSYIAENGIDARNYGVLDGLLEVRKLFSDLLDIPKEKIIIGGNSSLNLIYDTLTRLYIFGSLNNTPWGKLEKVKILCPCPGYDRHFAICEKLGYEMIPIPLLENGPDMDMIEKLVSEDEFIKGILCIPLYSNPDGTCYSDEVVTRIASMKTAAKDFKIFWDNAYGVHHIYSTEKIQDIFKTCEKYGTEDRIYYFFSTSKITFPGSGVALIAASEKIVEETKKHMAIQTIGYDKLNQLRLLKYFKTAENIKNHMKLHAEKLKPKFDIVLNKLDEQFKDTNILKWKKPKGGYFISVDTIDGCAKETVRLAKEAGVNLTDAGSCFPYKKDIKNSNIRIAPSYPTINELKEAIEILCICIKLAAVNKLLENK